MILQDINLSLTSFVKCKGRSCDGQGGRNQDQRNATRCKRVMSIDNWGYAVNCQRDADLIEAITSCVSTDTRVTRMSRSITISL